MRFDSNYFGPQQVVAADFRYEGSRYSEVRRQLFENAYYLVWRAAGEPPLPKYEVTLGRVLRGCLPLGLPWLFKAAAARALDSRADMRWGENRRGYRRLLHPNGVCLFGSWVIDNHPTGYTGYFQKGSSALIVARYSTCCTETRRGHFRSLSMVGKLYPTTNPEHQSPLRTANFITQQDLGGEWTEFINDAELRNAPDTTPWRRGLGLPILLLTGLAFMGVDREPTIRQLYPIAELAKPPGTPTVAPRFMRLKLISGFKSDPKALQTLKQPPDLSDFREEVLHHIYDPGDPTPRRELIFSIEVSDQGTTVGKIVQRRRIPDDSWQRIGKIVFQEAVASYNGDFVLHFHHPPWRSDRNNPESVVRKSPVV